MPFEVTYEKGGLGVYVRGRGRITLADTRATFDSIWKRPESARICYHILEGGPDAHFDFKIEELRQVGMLVPEMLGHSPGVRIAFVAPGPALGGVLRLIMIYSQVWGGNPKMRRFSNLEAAREWIARERPELASEPES